MIAALTISEFQHRPAARPASYRHEAEPRYELAKDGCSVAKTCLACPLPACRYDDPFGQVRAQVQARIEKVQQLRDQGHDVDEIARQLGISVRTVYRDTDAINAGMHQ